MGINGEPFVSSLACWFQTSFQENQIDGGDQAEEGSDVVPVERLPFEQQCHHHREDDERDDLLRDFQLNQRERSAVVNDADAVRRHLTDIFKQRDAPREENHGDERPRRTDFFLLKFEVPIPGKGHEDVGADE